MIGVHTVSIKEVSMDLDSIVINPIPEMGAVDLSTSDMQPTLQIGGRYYSLTLLPDTSSALLLYQAARESVSIALESVDSYRAKLCRIHESLLKFKSEMENHTYAQPMSQSAASLGFRMWIDNSGNHIIEKSLQYWPQRLQSEGEHRDIKPGQFTPRIVTGIAHYDPLQKTFDRFSTWTLQGSRFVHYHTVGDYDCVEELDGIVTPAWSDIIALWLLWQGQLSVINLSSLGNAHPRDMPPSADIQSIVTNKEGTPWGISK